MPAPHGGLESVEDSGMGKLTLVISGLLLGAGGMFLLDPSRGRRRRAMLRIRVSELSRSAARAGRTAGKVSRRTWARISNGSGKVLATTGKAIRHPLEALAH
jgi:hypothetical protein